MSDLFMPGASPKDRLETLQVEAEAITEGNYYRRLSDDEVTADRKRVTDLVIEVAGHDEVLKEAKDAYKDATSHLKKELGMVVTEVKTGQRMESGKLYHLRNEKTTRMDTYNEHGVFVSSRPLTNDELLSQQRMPLSIAK